MEWWKELFKPVVQALSEWWQAHFKSLKRGSDSLNRPSATDSIKSQVISHPDGRVEFSVELQSKHTDLVSKAERDLFELANVLAAQRSSDKPVSHSTRDTAEQLPDQDIANDDSRNLREHDLSISNGHDSGSSAA